jgi:hypothetical protein
MLNFQGLLMRVNNRIENLNLDKVAVLVLAFLLKRQRQQLKNRDCLKIGIASNAATNISSQFAFYKILVDEFSKFNAVLVKRVI